MKLRVGNINGELSESMGSDKVFIDSTIMDQMSLNDGDPVKLEGSEVTVCKAVSSPPADKGLGVIRLDKFTRENCGASLGESVDVKPVDLAEGTSVTLAPADKDVMIQLDDPEIFKNSLKVEYLREGDKVIPVEDDSSGGLLSGFSGNSDFGFKGTELMVVELYPDNQVEVTENTDFKVEETIPEEFIDESEEHPVPSENRLELAEEPDIEEKERLEDLDQLEKLSDAGAFLGCFDKKNERIWIYGDYYYVEDLD